MNVMRGGQIPGVFRIADMLDVVQVRAEVEGSDFTYSIIAFHFFALLPSLLSSFLFQLSIFVK